MNIRALGTAAALLLATTGAMAANVGKSFSDLDVNKDGYLSVDETMVTDTLATNWYRYDINSDGMLDQAEFSAFEESEPWPWILKQDWQDPTQTIDKEPRG